MFRDLVGETFNELTVIKLNSENPVRWLCKCSCGNTTTAMTNQLTSGKKKSCGCLRHKPHGDTSRLLGKKFNSLTVIAFDHFGTARKDYWKCKCDCGNETVVQGHNLQSGLVISCGCSYKLCQLDNISGLKTGMVTVKRFMYRKNLHSYYLCECDCGNTFIANSNNIKRGHYQSCGCINKSNDESSVLSFVESIIDPSLIETNQRILKVSDDARNNLEIDIYISKMHIGIEYNGSAFHSSVNSAYNDKPINYHQTKFLKAKEQGIRLISIFDIDCDNDITAVKYRLASILQGTESHEAPTEDIVYTNNDYDDGLWLKEYGYVEDSQVEPEYYIYNNRFKVYRCGKTKWIKKE